MKKIFVVFVLVFFSISKCYCQNELNTLEEKVDFMKKSVLCNCILSATSIKNDLLSLDGGNAAYFSTVLTLVSNRDSYLKNTNNLITKKLKKNKNNVFEKCYQLYESIELEEFIIKNLRKE